MFFRWKNGDWPGPLGCARSSAYLVKSIRTASGPRHKHVCYLGSVYDHSLKASGKAESYCESHGSVECQRRHFWESADRNLARAGIGGAELAKVLERLERTVPRPAG